MTAKIGNAFSSLGGYASPVSHSTSLETDSSSLVPTANSCGQREFVKVGTVCGSERESAREIDAQSPPTMRISAGNINPLATTPPNPSLPDLMPVLRVVAE